MHNFLIIFLITYLAVVYCFKNNNRLRKNTKRVNQIRSFNNTNQRSLFGTGDDVLLSTKYFFENSIKIYFKNGYVGFIGNSYYWYLLDNNGHVLAEDVNILNSVSTSTILNLIEIDDSTFAVIVKGSSNSVSGIYCIKYNLRGEEITDPELITELYSSSGWSYNDHITWSSSDQSKLDYTSIIYSIWIFYSGGPYSRTLFGVTFDQNMNLVGSQELGMSASRQESNSGCSVTINNIGDNFVVHHYYSAWCVHCGRSYFTILRSIYNENFILIDGDENDLSYEYGAMIFTFDSDNYFFEFRKPSDYTCFKFYIYDSTGTYIKSVSSEVFESPGYKGKFLNNFYKVDNNNFIISSNFDNPSMYDITIEIDGSEFNFYFKNEEYYKYFNQITNNIRFDFWYESQLNENFYSRLDYTDKNLPLKLNTPEPGTEPDYSIIENIDPIPTFAPTQGYVDSENSDLPNNDNDEANEDGKSPGENPNEDQDNTDEDESNNEGLAIGLSVPLVFVSILLAAYCYLNKKGVVWKYTKEGFNTTSVEFSLGKGNNSLSKEVKIEEVIVQYDSDDQSI